MSHPLHAFEAAIALCVFCPKLCRYACPVAEAEVRETVTPWALMTRVDDLRRGAAPLDAEAAELWAHCTGCGRCTAVCKHDNDVFAVLKFVRGMAVEVGVAPAAPQTWADAVPEGSESWAALPTDGDVRLIPGHATEPVIADAIVLLRAAGWHPAQGPRTTGRRREAIGAIATPATAPLNGTLITLEAADAVWLKAQGGPARVLSLPEALDGRLPKLAPVLTGDVIYQDTCQLGRGLGVYEAPRRLLAAVITGTVREAVMHHEEGGCCGAGAGYPAIDPVGAAAVAYDLLADGPLLPVVLADAGCASHLAESTTGPVHRLAALLVQALDMGARA